MSTTDLKNIGTGLPPSDGRTVPAGYFEDFAKRMMEQVPETIPVKAEPRRTVWQKVRPYVYMAAMFAGVYLMMNIFTLAGGMRDAISGPDTSSLLAELVNSSGASYIDECFTMADPYLYDDLYESGYEIPDIL